MIREELNQNNRVRLTDSEYRRVLEHLHPPNSTFFMNISIHRDDGTPLNIYPPRCYEKDEIERELFLLRMEEV